MSGCEPVMIRSATNGRRTGYRASFLYALTLLAAPLVSVAEGESGAGAAAMGDSVHGTPVSTGAAPSWGVGLYAEGDSEGGIGGLADVSWFVGERSQLYLAANYADTTGNLSGLATRGVSVGGAHDFGPVGVDLWYDGWQDPDVVTARSTNAAIDLDLGDWTVGLTGQVRGSDFEPFIADAVVTLRTGQQVTVVAAADCDLDNTGLGLRIGYGAGPWRARARGMVYSYSDTECRFSSPALDYLRRTRPVVFQQFARQVTTPLSTSATTWIGAENALLDRSWGGGLAYDTGRLEFALDYLGLKEHFDGLRSDSVTGSVTVAAGKFIEVRVTAGYSEGESLDPAWLGGLGLRTVF